VTLSSSLDISTGDLMRTSLGNFPAHLSTMGSISAMALGDKATQEEGTTPRIQQEIMTKSRISNLNFHYGQAGIR
jgi:hypothetical protein